MRLDFVPGVRRVAALTSEHCGAGCRVQGMECRGAGWRGRGAPWTLVVFPWLAPGQRAGRTWSGKHGFRVAERSGARPGGPAAEPALRPLRLSFPGTGSAMSL